MKFGLDRFFEEKEYINSLKGKKLSLVLHPASTNKAMDHALDLFVDHPELDVVSAFGPQHGVFGEKQDNMIESESIVHPQYKIPVWSLYGEHRKPTAEMMQGFDVLIFDLQDVGCRIYTYLTTLVYLIDAAVKHNKKVIVLDRPNPAGRHIEGTYLKPDYKTFVGALPIPMRHGLTLGEAGNYYIKANNLGCDYEVVTISNYKKHFDLGWDINDRAWVNPSPNIPCWSSTHPFIGTVLIEGTHLSEGRGTTRPLEVFGAPGLDHKKILKKMKELKPEYLEGVLIRHCYFEPTFQKHKGHICEGLQLHTDDSQFNPKKFKPYRLIALYLKTVHSLYPEYDIFKEPPYEYEKILKPFDMLSGSHFLREWVLDSDSTIDQLESILKADEEKWDKERKAYLLY